ncbi:MAG: hypothetical protein M3136_08495 [Thermoproteota archaeon]|nr:hypothetical protein [Thermoproteota archaeon]
MAPTSAFLRESFPRIKEATAQFPQTSHPTVARSKDCTITSIVFSVPESTSVFFAEVLLVSDDDDDHDALSAVKIERNLRL